MRRALLAAAAAFFPALAQPTADSGQVIVVDNFDAPNVVSYLNKAACAAGVKATLEWTIRNVTSVSGGTYTLYSSSKDPSTRPSPDTNFCNQQNDTTNNVTAGSVGGATATNTTQQLGVLGTDIATKAGKTCDAASEGQNVWVCAHFTTSASANPTGWAWGRVMIQVGAPNAPTLDSVGAGDGQLIATFTPPAAGGTVEPHDYVACATLAGSPDICSPSTTASPATISGLTNDKDYVVVVYSVSVGGNRSDPSTNQITARPLPAADFWDVYKDRGGVEQGGCGTGATAAPALLGAVALLALRRRAR